MHFRSIIIRAFYDDEASVWIASSQDIEGLAIEAPSLEELQARIPGVLQDLVELNGYEVTEGAQEIPYHLMAEATGRISIAN